VLAGVPLAAALGDVAAVVVVPPHDATTSANATTADRPLFTTFGTIWHLTPPGVSTFYTERMTSPATFGELLEQHEREIYAYALRLTGDRDDADDVYQDTFLAAFRAWPPPRRGSERAWLYRIATNKAIDRGRRAKRLVRLGDLPLAAPERDGVSLADLVAAVKALPTGQRAAFVLRKVQGLSYAEVSVALECSEEAARSRVAEAMKKVKEAMR
jgi:RNA polymerase sigma-70 factor (ECF subfamily)